MFGLESSLIALLIICLLCACLFEFINGFHDTANAVATVIYTNSLRPSQAVIWSGLMNFFGVMAGGISVAMGIVSLLPLDILVDANVYHSIGMILSLLLTAIFWNFLTWYLAIPCSSSHTLIGSILGVGLGYSLLKDVPQGYETLDWNKAKEIGVSLLISPLFGFSVALLLMRLLQQFFTTKHLIFKQPEPQTKPPLPIRMVLIATCTLVSFFHGSNDGQKGVGLVMLILIGIVPSWFALNRDLDEGKLVQGLKKIEPIYVMIDENSLSEKSKKSFQDVGIKLKELSTLAVSLKNKNMADSVKVQIRKDILVTSKILGNIVKKEEGKLDAKQREQLKSGVSDIKAYTDYAPWWAFLMISISLGLGTMIGWRRIVITIGEKIGKQHMNYAQGASAELVAASTIGISTWLGLPVSTTHVLSSGVGGAMVASKGVSNLQANTVRNILIAWVLTLPVCLILGGGLFLLFRIIL